MQAPAPLTGVAEFFRGFQQRFCLFIYVQSILYIHPVIAILANLEVREVNWDFTFALIASRLCRPQTKP